MFPIFIFTGMGVRTTKGISAAVRLFPQEAKTADAVCRSGLACKEEFRKIRRFSGILI